MKTGTITFEYFEKGDYIITGWGVGIVVEDEEEIYDEEDLNYSEIHVQHKFSCSENTSNSVMEVEREMVSKITKEQYEAEKF